MIPPGASAGISKGGSGTTPIALLNLAPPAFSRQWQRVITVGSRGWGLAGRPPGMPLVPDPTFGDFGWAFSPYSEWPPVDAAARWAHFVTWFEVMYGPADVLLAGLAQDFVWGLYGTEFAAHERFWLCGSWSWAGEHRRTMVTKYVPQCIAPVLRELQDWRPNTGVVDLRPLIGGACG